MTNILLLGSHVDRLTRVRDTLTSTGYQVYDGISLANAHSILESHAIEILIVDVDESVGSNLASLDTLLATRPRPEMLLTFAATPAAEQPALVEATQSLGLQIHLPSELIDTPLLTSAVSVVADRRRLREIQNEHASQAAESHGALIRLKYQNDVMPDYSYLEQQVAYTLSTQTNASMMLIGIDNLQDIRATRGERAAWQNLDDLAELLLSDLRDTDIVTHTPAMDRFAVLLPLTHADQARTVAERIRRKMARRSLGSADVRAGIAEAHVGVDAESLLHEADKAWEMALLADEKIATLPRTPAPEFYHDTSASVSLAR